jgi:tRNA threonylcarbamoyladenosine biosynthesis protein TsaE
MAEFISRNEKETEALGARLARSIPGGAVIAMYGDLGAGKTAFVRGMAQGLELDCRVSSPTFTIVNEYRSGKGFPVYHFDFYRINNISEAFDIGTDEYFGGDGICLIEWPEKIREILPDDCFKVFVHADAEGNRTVEIED